MHAKINYLYFCIASSLLASLAAVDTNQAPVSQPEIPPLRTANNNLYIPLRFMGLTGAPALNLPATTETPQDGPVYDQILLVGLFMMKDEAHIFEKTLNPYVKAGIKHFLIYEGGKSSDNTVDVAKKYFKDHNLVHGYVVQGTFGDFATARNNALNAAHEKFPNAAFVLFPDAEWYLHNGEKLFDFCKEHLNEKDVHSYSVRIMNASIDFDTPRLIRNDGVARFKGRVHEVPLPASAKQAPRDVYFELGGTAIGAEKSRKRWERDIEALMLDHLDNPADSRPIFYIGQSHDGLAGDPKPCLDSEGQKLDCFTPGNDSYLSHCCNDLRERVKHLHEAYKFYVMRASMKVWDQEDFVATHRAGNIAERLYNAGVPGYTWGQALEHYIEAYNMRPSRIDPLVQIAEHYWNKNINTGEKHLGAAFLFARRAAETPYPQGDLLFVPKGFYDFKRYEQLSKISAYVGECPVGERATDILLQSYPNDEQLKNNKKLYEKCTVANTDLWGYNTQCPKTGR